jgi:limonene-1,2-epoxide hydrolase
VSANEKFVMKFFDHWVQSDLDAIVDSFCEDGVYHNIPMERLEGRDAIRETVGTWLKTLTNISFRFGTCVSQGNVVVIEHFDQIPTASGTRELPVLGLFELRDGKIAEWREYFDLGQMAALQRP